MMLQDIFPAHFAFSSSSGHLSPPPRSLHLCFPQGLDPDFACSILPAGKQLASARKPSVSLGKALGTGQG